MESCWEGNVKGKEDGRPCYILCDAYTLCHISITLAHKRDNLHDLSHVRVLVFYCLLESVSLFMCPLILVYLSNVLSLRHPYWYLKCFNLFWDYLHAAISTHIVRRFSYIKDGGKSMCAPERTHGLQNSKIKFLLISRISRIVCFLQCL